jgi:hypothetical protein
MAADDGGGSAARVERTGIALVHEGELIVPAAGSEAFLEQVTADQATVVQYHVPVEIEVRAAGEPVDPDDVVAMALDSLTAGLEAI